MKLKTTIERINEIPNSKNLELVNNFREYTESNDCSEHHENNNLKVVSAFCHFLGKDKCFYDIKNKGQILEFLDTKIKPLDQDPDKRWITTWNKYLNRLKLFYRWRYNHGNDLEHENWETPEFIKIKSKEKTF